MLLPSRHDNLSPLHHPGLTAGFSLIELLVSIALLAIISGIGVSIFAIINNSYTRANAISKMQTQGQHTLEQLERSIRSASKAELATNGTNGCAASQCLILTIPTGSIEADLNGGCAKTVYSWSAPTFTQGAEANGQIQRYARQADYTTPCGSPAVGLFDSDPSLGVSVEQQGSASVFAVDSANASTVTITLHLTEGAKLKPTAGSDTRANVPLKTTTSLRNY